MIINNFTQCNVISLNFLQGLWQFGNWQRVQDIKLWTWNWLSLTLELHIVNHAVSYISCYYYTAHCKWLHKCVNL